MSPKNTENIQNLRLRGHDGRFVKASKAVILRQDEFDAIQEQTAQLGSENYKLGEQLNNVQMMIDVKGWSPVFNYGADGGLSLEQIHGSSQQLRELVVGNPFVKRGSQIRNTYVLGDGVEFSASTATGKSAMLTAAVRELMEHPRNLRYLFSPDAMEELERAAYTDGNVFILADSATKTFQRLSVESISADLRNPENPEEIWAYRRVWTKNPNSSQPEQSVAWYYTDIYDGPRRGRIQYGSGTEAVDLSKVIIDKSFNRQVGWAYGVPDALPIIAWARLYKEFLVNGYIMSRAMAQLAYKVTASTASGANRAAIEVSRPGEGGGTTIQGEGNDITAMSTAGKGYDFDSGRPLAAAIAAGVEVSLVALLSDPGAGGGSYGTAQTLDAPARATATRRRASWEEFWVRIFRFMGNTKKLKITWHDLTEEQIQRRLQAWVQAHNTGLFEGDVIQSGISREIGLADSGAIPEGYMLPNNSNSLARKDVDTDGSDDQSGSSSAGTGQGQSNPAGSLGNDHSTDET